AFLKPGAALAVAAGPRLHQDVVNRLLDVLDQVVGIAQVDEPARDNLRVADHLALTVDVDDDHHEAVARQNFAVLHHRLADVAHAAAVDKHVAARYALAGPDVVLVDLD